MNTEVASWEVRRSNFIVIDFVKAGMQMFKKKKTGMQQQMDRDIV